MHAADFSSLPWGVGDGQLDLRFAGVSQGVDKILSTRLPLDKL